MLAEMYYQLIGSRINRKGELFLLDFTDADYEELWSMLIEKVVMPDLRDRDYFFWLEQWAHRYSKHRANNRYFQPKDDPFIDHRPEELNTRQQLAVIKFFMGRKMYSGIDGRGNFGRTKAAR